MCDYSMFVVKWKPVSGPLPTPCHIRVKANGDQSALDRDGYAHVSYRDCGKSYVRQAHRVRFIQAVGAIPEDKVLDHLCRNRACCNPDHLEPVTQAENVRRSRVAKLTQGQVNDIILLASSGVSQGKIAAEYGVHQSHVSRIVRGEFWGKGSCVAWEIVKSRRAEARAAR